MKKYLFGIVFSALLLHSTSAFALDKKTIEAKGEIVSTSPISSSVTIKHGVIKGFSDAGETNFVVASKDLLNNLSRFDLVNFTIVDDKGNAQIEKISKTGVAEPEKNGLAIGEAARDVLKATSETASFVTSPIPPAQGLVNDTVGAVANGTGEAVQDASVPNTKNKF